MPVSVWTWRFESSRPHFCQFSVISLSVIHFINRTKKPCGNCPGIFIRYSEIDAIQLSISDSDREMAMNIDVMKTFCDLVDTGSFSKAAEANYVSQSAVSQQLAKLEKNMSTQLISRGGGLVAPTEAGNYSSLRTTCW